MEEKKEMLISVASMHLEKSKKTNGYTQLIITTDDGDEYIVGGDYCGGVPVSSWHKIKKEKPSDR